MCNARKQRRRGILPHLQFRLRSLLFAILLACVALGGWAGAAHRQRVAVSAIEAAGASVSYEWNHYDAPFTADEASEMFTDKVQQWLPDRLRASLGRDFFQHVRHIYLNEGDDVAAALHPIAAVKGVRRLWVCGALNRDLAIVTEMRDLRRLGLPDSAITDASVSCLVALRRLRHLDVSACPALTDACLTSVAALLELESLNLSSTAVDDAGLPRLRALTQLNTLDLSSTAVTDDGLRELANLPSLQRVSLSWTGVTSAGLAWLRERRPDLQVDCYSPSEIFAAETLMQSGLWRRALDRWKQTPADEYAPFYRSWMEARCKWEIGMRDEATLGYIRALKTLPASEDEWVREGNWTATGPWSPQIWCDLRAIPDLFELVAERRSDDAYRWAASAWGHVINGNWRDARADYRRSMQCVHGLELDFEYGLSCLATGDVSEYHAIAHRAMDGLADEKYSQPAEYGQNAWSVVARMSSIGPKGTLEGSRMERWVDNDGPKAWRSEGLVQVALYRLGHHQMVVELKAPTEGNDCAHYWFVRAMAQWRLGNSKEARGSYERGARWLDRRMEFDRVRGAYRDARTILEAEALRREANMALSQVTDGAG